MKKEPRNGVWVALRDCGCCVGVCIDDGDYPVDVNATKHGWLADGLSVLHITWARWKDTYSLTLMDECPHRLGAPVALAPTPLFDEAGA